MADVVVFHHAQGRTTGMLAFTGELRRSGHTVHMPDLFEGQTFASIGEGLRYAEKVGLPDEVIGRGVRAVQDLPADLVYLGFSLGVLPAQMLAQTREGARGAVLFDSCVPASAFGTAWPDNVPVQVHGMDADPIFVHDGDLDAARELTSETGDRELFLYPGDQHLFADSSLPGYNADATALAISRVLSFLDRI